jgi:deoxyuridine 5'-triphosphate nucleotidohydrolase
MKMTHIIKVKKLYEDVELPHYGRPGDAGLDLCSREDKLLTPGKQYLFKIGLSIALPEGTVGLIWDRSGMAAKHGIKTMAGVLDHTYRGELGVVLINLTENEYEVKRGDRIAQLLIQPIISVDVHTVEDLDETQRGLAGFGSTGR